MVHAFISSNHTTTPTMISLKTIRETWAKDRSGIFFVVAGDWEDVSEEYHTSGDLMWVGSTEHFHEITYKTASFFAIVDQITRKFGIVYSYAMKTDDDSYVALDRIASFLLSTHGGIADYIGKWGANTPYRNPSNRYYTSYEEYPEAYFPDYCQGLGFLLSSNLVRCAAKQMENCRFLKHEDVFIGLIARRCQVNRTLAVPEHSFRPYRGVDDNDLSAAEMAGKMIQHGITSDEDMIDHHKSAIDDRLVHSAGELNVGDVIEHYYSDNDGWCRGIVVAQDKTAKGTNITLYYSDGIVEEWPFRPYLGDFRKSNKSIK